MKVYDEVIDETIDVPHIMSADIHHCACGNINLVMYVNKNGELRPIAAFHNNEEEWRRLIKGITDAYEERADA